MDIEILDSGQQRNVYLSKKNISGEKRFAITSHSEEDVGVCFRNYLEPGQQGMCIAQAACQRMSNYNIYRVRRRPCRSQATLTRH